MPCFAAGVQPSIFAVLFLAAGWYFSKNNVILGYNVIYDYTLVDVCLIYEAELGVFVLFAFSRF